MERVALFDDGSLVRVRGYRERADRRPEGDRARGGRRRAEGLSRGACPCARRTSTTPVDRSSGTPTARRITLEIAEPAGGSRLYAYDDLTSLPLAVGRARGALEDLRYRFEKQDLAETKWDTSVLKTGTFLRRRADGVWYRVVHDDALDHDFELEELDASGEQGSHKMRIFVYRGDIPRLFEDPAVAGPRPPAPSPAPRR